ncbi:MAG: hypothetical protein QOC56_2805, partial [Alphaproteobacteria bacterium]|nr:hypothetical protein [Alphaproteobacteria bacterium]
EGMCGMVHAALQAAHPDWLRDRKVRTLMQIGLERNQKLADVPFVMDLAKSEDDKRVLRLIFGWTLMGRPFMAPPGIPEDRKAALIKAFDATMRDPEFVADAARQRLEISPVSGAEIDRFLDGVYSTPKPLVERAAKILSSSQ